MDHMEPIFMLNKSLTEARVPSVNTEETSYCHSSKNQKRFHSWSNTGEMADHQCTNIGTGVNDLYSRLSSTGSSRSVIWSD